MQSHEHYNVMEICSNFRAHLDLGREFSELFEILNSVNRSISSTWVPFVHPRRTPACHLALRLRAAAIGRLMLLMHRLQGPLPSLVILLDLADRPRSYACGK